MHTVFALLGLIAAVVLLACLAWLHWRAFRDGAIHDVLLFLTGVSVLSYIFYRWGRAKSPTLGMVGAGVVLAIVTSASDRSEATSHEPSSEEVATAVKPLILDEWKNSPEAGEATIQDISLVTKGGGRYSGFIEVTMGGRSERLELEVVIDRETIRWELKPLAK